MENFFVASNAERFAVFSLINLFLIIFVVMGFIIIYRNRNKIKNIPIKTINKLKIGVIVLMFTNMAIYYLAYIYYGVYDWKVHLPLHFCFISGYLYMLALLTNNQKLLKITYFFAFMGPLPAIIWPDIIGGLDNYIFYQFFISHHIFILSNFFFLYAYNHKIAFKDTLRAFGVANVIFIAMTIFNAIFNTNYIMSKSLPEYFLNMYPVFENINYPIIILEVTGIIIILLAYIPAYYKNKEVEVGNMINLDINRYIYQPTPYAAIRETTFKSGAGFNKKQNHSSNSINSSKTKDPENFKECFLDAQKQLEKNSKLK